MTMPGPPRDRTGTILGPYWDPPGTTLGLAPVSKVVLGDQVESQPSPVVPGSPWSPSDKITFFLIRCELDRKRKQPAASEQFWGSGGHPSESEV